MKIILLKDIPTLGKKNDVKEVSGGYARNFLLPQKLAEPSTDAAVKSLAAKKARDEREKSEEEKKYKAAAEKLKTAAVSFKVKMGEKGKAFGSVTAQKIADALARQGIAADKEWIVLDGAIKTTGEKNVPIHFPRGIAGEIKISIEAE